MPCGTVPGSRVSPETDSHAPALPLPQDPPFLDFIAARYDDAWTEIFATHRD